MHIPDWDETFLSEYEPARVVALQTDAGAGSVMVYCQSHLGLCYWPTRIGQRHHAMGERDWLAESLLALRQAGCEVFGYYSVIFNNDLFKRRPEWRVEPRPPLPGWAFHGQRYGQVCPNNQEYRAYLRRELTELFTGYRFDGFFFDMTFWRGVCQCPSCQQRFRAEVGAEMPPRIDWADPAWCEFQLARERWLVEFTAFLNDLAREHGITVVYHNFAVSLFNWKFGMSTDLWMHNDFLGGDFYGDMDEQFLISRYMLNLSKTQPIEFMTSRCTHLTDHVSAKPLAQLHIQAFAALASNAAFRLIDAIDPQGSLCEAVYPELATVFERLTPYHPWLGGVAVEDVVVYLSDYSKMSLEENGRDYNDPVALGLSSPHLSAARGAARALRQQHIPVGVITRKQLKRLGEFPAIVLPDVLRMSQEEADALTAYVTAGGCLYASGGTGMYSLTGKRTDSALAKCLGLQFLQTMPGRTMYLEPKTQDWRALCLPQSLVCVHDAVQQVAVQAPAVEVLGCLTLPYGFPHEGTLDDQHWASIHSAPPGLATDLPVVTRQRFGLARIFHATALYDLIGADFCAEWG
jgi:hypothetical protein